MNNYLVEKKTLPLIPLRGISIFPNMVIHFDVGREKSIEALEKSMMDDSSILLCTQKDPKIDEPSPEEFFHIGTVSKVKQILKLPEGSIRVLVEGINRGRIENIVQEYPYLEAEVEEFSYEEGEVEKSQDIEAAMRLVIENLETYVGLSDKVNSEVIFTVTDIDDPGRLADVVSSYLVLKLEDNQKILETFDFYERLLLLHTILKEEIEILELEDKINQRVKKQMHKVQKEYYLREQLKAIQKELGGEDDIDSEVEEYREKIEELNLPKDAKEKALKEVDRLEKMSPYSQEVGVIRTYLDWIIDLPWDIEKEEKIDIKKSREILDEDHYGLKDVKERILEFIAIRKLTDSIKGPILCLVGPPGVGKTSIAKSIASSLNRDFVRMSLGGVRDEAEIRGHRRTYVGSMPGRIISSIRKAGSKNPVFLFDEIDKIGNDFRGDPASGLLEVLDPEQNATFTDHFLDVPFDLSNVLFVTTANTTASIPPALLDRMEVIRISGYTDMEKQQISLRHLIPNQMLEHGLSKDSLDISKYAIEDVIHHYTREAGIRNLERNIASLCRKAAKKLVEEDKKKIKINRGNLENYLGSKKFRFDLLGEENLIGVANGLAWTAVGGETLSIEVNTMKGNGKLQLTGKLGDVMKESAMAGMSYVRLNSDKFKIDKSFYKDTDIHIHVPEGAIPKDGPSAGITIASAVVSALCDIPIHRDVAMTGEITLRGRVLPVGGIKEKVLAAHRMGINKLVLPFDNQSDMEEIPEKIRRNLEFVFVKGMDEVLEHVLVIEDDKDENK